MGKEKILAATILISAAIASTAIADGVTIDRRALINCANTKSLTARARCYDELVETIIASGPTPAEDPSNGALFGRSDAEKREQLQESLGVNEKTAISANVSQVARTPHGKLLVSLDNGQVWRQLDSARLPLNRGESVRIEQAGLGSYLLEKSAGSRPIRVRRID